MTTFSFLIVQTILKNLGFSMERLDGITEVVMFAHPGEQVSLLIVRDDMGEVYLRNKMSEIHLPYGYFKSLANNLNKLKKK